MRNPTDFDGGTPFNYKKVIDKSHPAKEMKHNATRTSQATSYNYSKPVGKSGHDNIGNPYATAGDRTEMLTPANHFKPVGPSSPDAPRQVKKWHKRGYDMSLPTTLGGK